MEEIVAIKVHEFVNRGDACRIIYFVDSKH